MKLTIEGLLVRKGAVTERQLERARRMEERMPEKTVPEILLNLGYINEETLIRCAGKCDDMPVADLEEYSIDREAASYLPAAFVRRSRILPLGFEDGRLVIAVTFPTDPEVLDEAVTLTGMKVKPVLVLSGQMDSAVRKLYGTTDEAEGKNGERETSGTGVMSPEELLFRERVERAPVVRLVNEIIEEAYRKNASDIHVEPRREALVIRIRVNGDLITHRILGEEYHRPMVTRLKLLAGMDIAEKRLPQDGKFRYERGSVSTDLRMSTLPSVYGEKVVLRLLGNERNDALMDIRCLGMSEKQLEAFERILRAPHGVVLVTGPTGSGKTTTLYAVLSRMVRKRINIVTVEDPVEKMIDGITQVHMNSKTGLTFAAALRAILRQDPDVIMVGEMRDEETASIGVRAAVTGHLVLSTLHTNDCASAVDRLRNMGVPSYMIAAALTGVAAQRLVKVLCPHCRRVCEDGERQEKRIRALCGRRPEKIYRAAGCSRCSGTGYISRRAVYEIMEVDETMKELILRNAPAGELREYQRKQGFRSLGDHVMEMVLAGETDLEEAEKILYMESGR